MLFPNFSSKAKSQCDCENALTKSEFNIRFTWYRYALMIVLLTTSITFVHWMSLNLFSRMSPYSWKEKLVISSCLCGRILQLGWFYCVYFADTFYEYVNIKCTGIYPSNFDVQEMAQKTQSSNRVFKLNLHKISF